MNRREFLRRAGLLAAGAVAVDQLELLDRLGWTRTLFAGWRAPSTITVASPYGINVTTAQWDALLRECYVSENIASAITVTTPFRANFNRRQPRSLLKPAPVWSGRTIDVVSR